MSKYKNIKTGAYDSKREAARAQELRILERVGDISELREQVAFEIAPAVVLGGRKHPPRKYIADFVYMKDGHVVVEDAKGFKTETYRLKRHLMMAVHGIEVVEV